MTRTASPSLCVAASSTSTRRLSAQLPASPASPRMARDMARRLIGGADNGAVALVVTELVTNAVTHGRAAPTVSLAFDGTRLRAEVFDDAPGRPLVRVVPPAATSGRGIALVEAYSESWGVDAVHGGKVVWAEVVVDPPEVDAG